MPSDEEIRAETSNRKRLFIDRFIASFLGCYNAQHFPHRLQQQPVDHAVDLAEKVWKLVEQFS